MVDTYKEVDGEFVKTSEPHKPYMPKVDRDGYRDLKKLSGKIEQILEGYPITRDDDHILIGTLYHLYYEMPKGCSLSEVVKMVSKGDYPAFESITRCRRKIQEGGKFLGTKRTLRAETEVDVKEQIVNWGHDEET